MTIVKVHLPQSNNHSGKIRWARKEGDRVGAGEKLLDFDFEYLKVPMPSPCAGIVKTLGVQEGHGANSGAILATVEREDKNEPLSPLPICASCGLVRIGGATKCEHCGKDHAQNILSVPRDPAVRWVAIECKFQCRMCGFVVPLNHVEVDGAVICARCGLEQAFDERGWNEGLSHAHGVVDGMDDEVGNKKVMSREVVSTMNALDVSAAPGFPLCETCHSPFEITLDDGKSIAKCATCATTDYYVVPGKTRDMTEGALLAVVSVEHRSDRDAVKVEDASGALAIKCPSCSAPLEPVAGSKFVTCKFCNVTARVPDGILFKISGVDPKPELIWLAFHGPSRERLYREEQGDHERSQALGKKIEEAQDNARRLRDKAREEAEAPKRAAREAAEQQAKDLERAKKDRRDNIPIFVIAFVIFLIFGGTAIYANFFADGR